MAAGNLGAYSSPEDIARAVAMGALPPDQINAAIRASGLNTNSAVIQGMIGSGTGGGGNGGGGGQAIATRNPGADQLAREAALRRINQLQLLAAGHGAFDRGDFGSYSGSGMDAARSIPGLLDKAGPHAMPGDIRAAAMNMLGPPVHSAGRFAVPNQNALQAYLLGAKARSGR